MHFARGEAYGLDNDEETMVTPEDIHDERKDKHALD